MSDGGFRGPSPPRGWRLGPSCPVVRRMEVLASCRSSAARDLARRVEAPFLVRGVEVRPQKLPMGRAVEQALEKRGRFNPARELQRLADGRNKRVVPGSSYRKLCSQAVQGPNPFVPFRNAGVSLVLADKGHPSAPMRGEVDAIGVFPASEANRLEVSEVCVFCDRKKLLFKVIDRILPKCDKAERTRLKSDSRLQKCTHCGRSAHMLCASGKVRSGSSLVCSLCTSGLHSGLPVSYFPKSITSLPLPPPVVTSSPGTSFRAVASASTMPSKRKSKSKSRCTGKSFDKNVSGEKLTLSVSENVTFSGVSQGKNLGVSSFSVGVGRVESMISELSSRKSKSRGSRSGLASTLP